MKKYRISGIFRDYQIFAFFFAMSFQSQIIKYAEIVFCIIFYKKHFNSQKMTGANKKCYSFPPIFANFF